MKKPKIGRRFLRWTNMNYLLKFILSILFFIVITPIGFFLRLFQVDYLQIKGNKLSYWIKKR